MRSHARLLLLISLILLLIVTPALAAPNFSLTVSHVGNAGASGTTDFLVGSTTGTVSVEVKNSGDDTSSSTTVTITLAGGLTYGGSFTSMPDSLFTSCTGTTTVTCTAPSIPNGSDETITFPVTAPTTPDNSSFKNKAKVNSGSNVRPPFQGEYGFQGGSIRKTADGYLLAVFSGATGEEDFEIAEAGIHALQPNL